MDGGGGWWQTSKALGWRANRWGGKKITLFGKRKRKMMTKIYLYEGDFRWEREHKVQLRRCLMGEAWNLCVGSWITFIHTQKRLWVRVSLVNASFTYKLKEHVSQSVLGMRLRLKVGLHGRQHLFVQLQDVLNIWKQNLDKGETQRQ